MPALRKFHWILKSTLLAASATAAADSDPDVVAREAARYADCLLAADTQCIYELTHPLARIQSVGPVDAYPGPPNRRFTEGSEHGYAPLTQSAIIFPAAREHLPETGDTYWTLETGTPSFLEMDSELHFAVVPYRQESVSASVTERNGYFIAVSDDNARYELNLELRENIREQTPLLIAYQNPNNAAEPVLVRATLERRQKELALVSPLISGFIDGETYRVVVFGLDPETEDVLFEHHQPMVYRAVPGDGARYLPAISGIPGQSFPLPGMAFPAGWYENTIGAGISSLCPAAETAL